MRRAAACRRPGLASIRPNCSLVDPVSDQADLLGREAITAEWHNRAIRSGPREHLYKSTRSTITDNDGGSRVTTAHGRAGVIEAQATRLVGRSMASDAVLAKDWLDRATKIDAGTLRHEWRSQGTG